MKKRTVALVGEGLLFALASACFFLFEWNLQQRLTSSDLHLLESLPYLVALLLPTYALFVLHCLLWPRTKKGYVRTFRGNGIAFMILGAFLVILDVSLLLNGTFSSLVSGFIHPIYPLDTMLVGFVFELLGLFMVYWGVKKAKIQAEKLEIEEAPLRPMSVLCRYVAYPLFVLFALFFTGDLLFFFHTLDYEFQNVGVTLPFYLLMLLLPVELGLHEFLLRKKKGTASYARLMLQGVPAFLLTGVALSLWGYFGLLNHPLAFAESMFGIFPLDGEASISFGPLFLYFLNILSPLLYLFSFIFAKTHPTKQEK